MGSLPLGCDSHPVTVVFSARGVPDPCVCQYFAIGFPRPTNTILFERRQVGGGGRRPLTTSTGKTRQTVNCVLPGALLYVWVVVVSVQQLLGDGAHPVGSQLQGQDERHPLHFGVSPERLRDSAPAIRPGWRGLLQLGECPPSTAWPWAGALQGVTVKLVLTFL